MGKMKRINIPPTVLVFNSKTRSQFRSGCKKIREKSQVIKSEGFFGLLKGANSRKGVGELVEEQREIL